MPGRPQPFDEYEEFEGSDGTSLPDIVFKMVTGRDINTEEGTEDACIILVRDAKDKRMEGAKIGTAAVCVETVATGLADQIMITATQLGMKPETWLGATMVVLIDAFKKAVEKQDQKAKDQEDIPDGI